MFALLQFSCLWYPLWLGRGFHLTSLKPSVVGNFFAETLVRHPHKPVVLKVPLQTSRISNSWELTGMQGSWGSLNMLKGKLYGGPSNLRFNKPSQGFRCLFSLRVALVSQYRYQSWHKSSIKHSNSGHWTHNGSCWILLHPTLFSICTSLCWHILPFRHVNITNQAVVKRLPLSLKVMSVTPYYMLI